MKRWLVSRGPDLGLIGVAIALGASLLTAIAYSGPDGEPYSPINHTVSELGERGVSELAWFFNAALITGGILIALFMAGRLLATTDRSGRGFGLLGVVAGLSMALVGVFPVDLIEGHLVAAMLAFVSILVAAIWFAVWVFHGSAPYPRALGWFAVWIIVATVAFLVVPGIVQPEYTFSMEFEADPPPRPDVWLAPILEWTVIASAWIWIGLLAWHHRSEAREHRQSR
jgi:hypothetical membrane protein